MRYRHDANGKIMVGIHMDDFCLCGTNRPCLDEFRFALLDPAKGRFEGTYEGPLHHYLGRAITRDMNAGSNQVSGRQVTRLLACANFLITKRLEGGGLSLKDTQYALDLAARFMAEDSKPTPTPAKTYLTAAADLALNIDEKTEQK